ncbi:MAG: hypothetical protein FP826_01610 [Sphingomonadales bacterium]|nr:hypothetical protein [Sphingomonadales bacterium]
MPKGTTATPEDIELKFDGPTVRRLNGAPADAVIASLGALQRMVLILGMREEGRVLGQRLKPTAKVKRDFAIICRAPEHGSHVQPFNVASLAGQFTPAACSARERLLASLSAFDSGKEAELRRILPRAKERWFMAQAAADLLPPEGEDLQVSIRVGPRGRYKFKADRARKLIDKVRSGPKPTEEPEDIVGRLQAIDYGRTVLTVKPSGYRTLRVDYPLLIEPWLQANVRKRVRLTGIPSANTAGDVTGFKSLQEIAELEPTIPRIEEIVVGRQRLRADPPLSIRATYDLEDRLFRFSDDKLSIDACAETLDGLKAAILEEVDVLWRQYADAPDNELAEDALVLAGSLRDRFRVIA